MIKLGFLVLALTLIAAPTAFGSGATEVRDPITSQQQAISDAARQFAKGSQEVGALSVPMWPAGNESLITSPYGWRIHPIYGDLRFHYGLDIGVDEGTVVVAPLAGRVTVVEWSDSVGNTIEIDHGGGFTTRYCHLKTGGIRVAVGANVLQGQPIALSGNTGSLSTGAHLHFEVYNFNDASRAPYPFYYTIDPLSWLGSSVESPQPASANSFSLLYDYGGATASLWAMTRSGANLNPVMTWYSGSNAFDPARAKMTSGEFTTGTGLMDVAMLYDYGSSIARLWTYRWSHGSYTPCLAWGSGGFEASRAKIVSGNFDGVWPDDVAMLYDYGNATSRLWVFTNNGVTMTPRLVWSSGLGGFDASRVKLVAGNFNGSGADDIAMLYDYGNATSRLWTFVNDGSSMTPMMAWSSGPGGFNPAQAQLTAGNFNGTGPDDVAALYDYGNSTSRIWTFMSSGSTFGPTLAWASEPGCFNAARSKITAGLFNDDAVADIAAIYDEGNDTGRVWIFSGSGDKMTPNSVWYSGAGAFEVGRWRLN